MLGNTKVSQTEPACRDVGLVWGQREHRRVVDRLGARPGERGHVNTAKAFYKGIPVLRREQNKALADVGCGVARGRLPPIDDAGKGPAVSENVVPLEVEVGPRHGRTGNGRTVIEDAACRVHM